MGSFKFNLITLLLICTTELSAQLAPEKGSNITGNITSTHLMELDKFMNMTKVKIDNNCALGLYFNFFGDDDLYIYNIRDINTIECEVISLWCAKTTAADNGNTYKQMINIPTTKAQIYKRKDGIWYRVEN